MAFEGHIIHNTYTFIKVSGTKRYMISNYILPFEGVILYLLKMKYYKKCKLLIKTQNSSFSVFIVLLISIPSSVVENQWNAIHASRRLQLNIIILQTITHILSSAKEVRFKF